MMAELPSEQTLFPRKFHDTWRVGVVFPAPYGIAMGNLGYQWVLRTVEETEGFCAERILPSPRPGKSPLSLESGRTPLDFDLLMASVSFESDYPALLRFLLDSGIPLLASDRNRHHPLIVAGGAALQVNPWPMLPFLDLALPGEGELLLPFLLESFREAPDRRSFLERASLLPGAMLPGGETPPHLGFLQGERLERCQPPFSNIIPSVGEFPGTLLVEIARGCPMGCRYCWAGFRYRPMRSFGADSILTLAEQARPVCGKIGLVSTAICQHPELNRLLPELRRMGYAIGVSSLRLPDLTDELLGFLAGGGEDSVTLAPEAGSDRLRRSLNKGFTNADILEACRRIFSVGIRKVKLYFMVGLPGEESQDVEAIVSLVGEVQALVREHQPGWGRPGGVVVGVGPFVPKPNTPFGRFSLADPRQIKKRLQRILSALGQLPHVEVRAGSVRDAQLQWALASGGRNLAPHLVALTRQELSLPDFLRVAENIREESLLWPEWGLSAEFLEQERRRAEEGCLTPPCPGNTRCRSCGICRPQGATSS